MRYSPQYSKSLLIFLAIWLAFLCFFRENLFSWKWLLHVMTYYKIMHKKDTYQSLRNICNACKPKKQSINGATYSTFPPPPGSGPIQALFLPSGFSQLGYPRPSVSCNALIGNGVCIHTWLDGRKWKNIRNIPTPPPACMIQCVMCAQTYAGNYRGLKCVLAVLLLSEEVVTASWCLILHETRMHDIHR